MYHHRSVPRDVPNWHQPIPVGTSDSVERTEKNEDKPPLAMASRSVPLALLLLFLVLCVVGVRPAGTLSPPSFSFSLSLFFSSFFWN
jgi:hypothetical protein